MRRLLFAAAVCGYEMEKFATLAIEIHIDRVMAQTPDRPMVVRPGAVVYSQTDVGVWRPLGKATGRERLHVIAVLRDLPGALGSSRGYFGDVTSEGGMNLRNVVVLAADAYPARLRTRKASQALRNLHLTHAFLGETAKAKAKALGDG